jgi:membrane fusion protein (multidrug efflux system)
MYVRVLIEQGIDSDAIAVPQQAVQRNGGGGSEVFVVKDDGRVAVQPVRTGSLQNGQWFLSDGLKAGDKVVVEGFQKFAPGDKVKPRIWTTEADASSDVVRDTKQTADAQR